MLVIEKELLIADYQKDSLLHVVNIDNLKDTYRIAPYGAGPHDFNTIVHLQYLDEDKLIAIYDRLASAMSYYQIADNKVELDKNTFVKKDRVKTLFGNLIPFGDNYATDGVFDNKMFKITNTTSDTLETFGEYPGDTTGISNPTDFYIQKLYKSIISNPQKDRMASAAERSDWLVFYKIDSKGILKLKEYFSYDCIADVKHLTVNNATATYSEPNERTIASYQDLYATEQHLYALYYGFPELDKDNPDNTCYILQFDWEGNYQKAYHLQEVINRFAVDEQRNCIYATYTAKGEDPVLLKYEIK